MTFNIASAIGTEDDGENAWSSRAGLNVATIERYAPDLIGLQQLDAGNLETYRSELPHYLYILGPGADTRELPDHNAIYWNPDHLFLFANVTALAAAQAPCEVCQY